EPGWIAGDGDPVRCTSCGAVGWVSADGEHAYIAHDDEDPVNVAAYDADMARWEKSQREKAQGREE
ncbi:unnamed protein product, partial [marine sediment metagenome]